MTPAFASAVPVSRHTFGTSHFNKCQQTDQKQSFTACAIRPQTHANLHRPADVHAFDPNTSSLRSAILAVAVGKFGEKPIPQSLFPSLSDDLFLAESLPNPPLHLLLQRASFLGALFMKQSLSSLEHALLVTHTVLPRTEPFATGRSRILHLNDTHVESTAVTAGHVLATVVNLDIEQQQPLVKFALRLLSHEHLSQNDACTLGHLLYADEPVTPLKALIAHVMRVRHESSDELAGLAIAVAHTTRTNLHINTSSTSSYVPPLKELRTAILAEPFDGVVTWDLLTPLIARHLHHKWALQVVMLTGESSGPKMGPNLHDLAKTLQIPSFHASSVSTNSNSQENTSLGFVADQADINSGLARWIEMRRVIVKRPALATVEKYADVFEKPASLFISSAFHPSYVEKMAVAAEAVGFGAYIIVGKGMEGSIGLGVTKRPSTLLVGWRTLTPNVPNSQTDRRCYQRHNLEYRVNADLESSDSPLKGSATCQQMADRIRDFVNFGSSGNSLFDARVSATVDALDLALNVIAREAPEVLSLNAHIATNGDADCEIRK